MISCCPASRGWYEAMNPEFFKRLPLIGMVHLGPLPGSGLYAGPADLDRIVQAAVADAKAIESGGMDAVMIENFFDAPFHKSDVPPCTVAAMTRAGMAVREALQVPIGFNVL